MPITAQITAVRHHSLAPMLVMDRLFGCTPASERLLGFAFLCPFLSVPKQPAAIEPQFDHLTRGHGASPGIPESHLASVASSLCPLDAYAPQRNTPFAPPQAPRRDAIRTLCANLRCIESLRHLSILSTDTHSWALQYPVPFVPRYLAVSISVLSPSI